MIDFKILWLLIISFFFLGYYPASAQNYIDIDLSPEKPKSTQKKVVKPAPSTSPSAKKKSTPPSKPSTTVKKTSPAAAPTTTSISPKPAAKSLPAVTKPKPAAKALAKKIKPSLKPKVDDALKLDPEPKVVSKKPVAPKVAQPKLIPPPPAPKIEAETTTIPTLDAPLIDPTVSSPAQNITTSKKYADHPKYKNRHAFTVDYTTWYEAMKLRNKATNGLVEGMSHYFGVSFNYDFTVYKEKYGYAITLGSVTGNAQAGTKDSGDYYERRIAWIGYRGGGRLFLRANNRIDLGFGFIAQAKTTKWPEEENFLVLPQANPQYFYYLDTRWRLNYKYEIVQAFGTHLRSYALAWLIGVNYTLN